MLTNMTLVSDRTSDFFHTMWIRRMFPTKATSIAMAYITVNMITSVSLPAIVSLNFICGLIARKMMFWDTSACFSLNWLIAYSVSYQIRLVYKLHSWGPNSTLSEMTAMLYLFNSFTKNLRFLSKSATMQHFKHKALTIDQSKHLATFC